MYSEDLKLLMPPGLSVPDVYPQENRQKKVKLPLIRSEGSAHVCHHVLQDEMTDYNVQKGFSNKPALSREV